VVARMDPSIPLYGVTTMEEALRGSTAQTRFNTLLLGLLSGVGLVLAAVGIYSVIAYFVSLRQQEIGIRMALGATPRDVLALMTWQGVRPVFAGLLLGAAGAFATTRLLRGSVYGVSVTDPLTALAVLALLVGVALVATLVPARRATRVSPGEALQSA
jgi:putative ABC transport system permease protein